MSEETLQHFKVDELKEQCRAKGLKVSGNKHELIQRLINTTPAKKQKTSSSEPSSSTNPSTTTVSETTTKEKKPRKNKCDRINDQLIALGVKNIGQVSNCLRKAIYKGFISLNGENPLQQVVYSAPCISCSKPVNATVEQLLYQPDYAGTDYEEGSENATVACTLCEAKMYVTGLCNNKPEFDSGKFHNHCTECKNFGQCIGDYREAHCSSCGKHYFQGLSGFDCPRCNPSEDEYGFSGGRGFGGGRRKRGQDCIIV